MAWGKEWPKPDMFDVAEEQLNVSATYINALWQSQQGLPVTGLDLSTGEKVVLTEYKDGVITHTDIIKEYKNKVPTHDPYSNPDSHIYYECACGAILDPGTKSFAALNNAASAAGWKVRFGVEYYVPYCVKCGEGVE